MKTSITAERLLSNVNRGLYEKACFEYLSNLDEFESVVFICDSNDSRDFANSISKSVREIFSTKFIGIESLYGETNSESKLYIDCLFSKEDESEIRELYKFSLESNNLVGLIFPTGYRMDSGRCICKKIVYSCLITMSANPGLYLNDCLDSCEKVINLDGLLSDNIELLKSDCTEPLFASRRRNTNKGNYLTASIIGGCKRYMGAATLAYSSLCALKFGCGYSYLVVPESLRDIYALRQPQVILKTLSDNDGLFIFDKEKLDEVMSHSDVVAFGMGIGVSKDVYMMIDYILHNFTGKLVIDADGLNSIAKYGIDSLIDHNCDVIITPHIKEFSRLRNLDVEDVLDQPIYYAKEFARRNKVTLLLKSASSIITNGYDVSINITGNAGLAKAGSGDLLSGIVGGVFSEKNLDSYLTSRIGSYLFGYFADEAAEKVYVKSLTSKDIVDEIGPSLLKLSKKYK